MTDILQIGSPVLMLCVGAAFLFLGYRLVKVVAVVNLGVLGVVVGGDAARWMGVDPPLLGAAVGGLLFALLAVPLLRAAVVVAVAALAGLVAKTAWVSLGGRPPLEWAALAGGFLLGALLALIFYRFIMIATSALMGAALVVCGAVSLMIGRVFTGEDLQAAPPGRIAAAGAAFVVLFLVGVLAQYRGARRRPMGKPEG